MNPVKSAQENPNAVVGAASGIGGGALVIGLLDVVGVHVSSPYVATSIAGAVTAAALFLGRNGIRGFLRMVWRGSGG